MCKWTDEPFRQFSKTIFIGVKLAPLGTKELNKLSEVGREVR